MAVHDDLDGAFQHVVELLSRVRVHGHRFGLGPRLDRDEERLHSLVDEVEGQALVAVVQPAVHLHAAARPGDRVDAQARLLPGEQGREVHVELARHLVQEAGGDVRLSAFVAAIGVQRGCPAPARTFQGRAARCRAGRGCGPRSA